MNAEQHKGGGGGGERGSEEDEKRMTRGRFSLIAYLILSLPLYHPFLIYYNSFENRL